MKKLMLFLIIAFVSLVVIVAAKPGFIYYDDGDTYAMDNSTTITDGQALSAHGWSGTGTYDAGTGRTGRSLKNGNDARLTPVVDFDDYPETITWDFWFREGAASASNDGVWLQQTGSLEFGAYWAQGGNFVGRLRSATPDATIVTNSDIFVGNAWHHFKLRWYPSNTTIELYLNDTKYYRNVTKNAVRTINEFWLADSTQELYYDDIKLYVGTVDPDATYTITNSSFNVTDYQYLLSNSTAWNSNAYINLSKNLLTFTFSTNVNTNASCSIHNLNYTDMIAKNANYKLATTATTSHSYTLFDNLTAFNSTTCVYCAYYDGVVATKSGCLKTMWSDTISPTITRTSQKPADITIANILSNEFFAYFNITDESPIDKANMFYKTNQSNSDIGICTLSACTSGYLSVPSITNVGTNYTFNLDDNDVMPASYNIRQSYMENVSHSSAAAKTAKMRLYSVDSTQPYGFFEVMANTTGAQSLNVYYCNSTYTSGSLSASPYCGVFANIPSGLVYNHTHSIYSAHKVVPFSPSSGIISGVKVTNISYFAMDSIVNWNFFYISNDTATLQTSANSGASWSAVTGTLDSHIHQFSANTSFHYYVCANDTFGYYNCSGTYVDTFDILRLKPSSVNVFLPTYTGYKEMVNISYTNSSVFIGADTHLNFYLLKLVNVDETFVSDIFNNTLNLTYSWNSSATPEGTYRIKVEAWDNNSLFSESYSSNFTIDRTQPTCSLFISGLQNGTSQWFLGTFTDVMLNWVQGFANLTGFSSGNTSLSSVSYEQNVSITLPALNESFLWGFNVSDWAGNVRSCTNTNKTNNIAPVAPITPATCTTSNIMLSLYILMVIFGIALIFFGVFAKVPFIGFFGALTLICASWLVAPCVSMFGYLLAGFGLVCCVWFAVAGFSHR